MAKSPPTAPMQGGLGTRSHMLQLRPGEAKKKKKSVFNHQPLTILELLDIFCCGYCKSSELIA